jgi:serine/threonine-protein kinase
MSAPSLVGEVLDGRYKITKKLGEGGMGEVYAAEHVHIEKRVAVKLLRPEIVTNKEAVDRFKQEARSASRIGHKNIIGIEDFGQLPDGRIYLCMELLGGSALNDLLKEGNLTPDRLLNIMIQTCHGLGAAHAKGITHRDMKPENIFVTHGPGGEDVPKLLDFGIAKVAGNDGQNNLTRTGTIFGTPFYMAPEQALGQQVDARVDIYAMGVILYEVFSGSLPFQGESFMGILTQHITTEPEPVMQRAMKAGRVLPPGMDQIIAKAMAKDPERRYQTMDELVQALVPVYRAVAGSGMSAYMEAYQPPKSAMMQAAPHSGGQPAPGAAQMATMMHGGGPPMQPPTQPPMHGYPHATPSPYQHQPPMPPPGPAPMVVSGSSSAFPASDGSMLMPAKKSKVGVIFAIVAVLAVIGGGIAVFVISQGKKGDETAGTDPGVQPDAGTRAAATPDAGTAAAAPDAGKMAAAAPDAAVAAATPDAAVAAAAPDAAPIAKVEPIMVLVDSNASGAEIYEGKKKVGKTPEMIKVVPGESRTFTIKHRKYKEKTVVVDGSQNEMKVVLEKKGGGGGGGGGGDGGEKEDPRKKFCRENPDDIRCQLEP